MNIQTLLATALMAACPLGALADDAPLPVTASAPVVTPGPGIGPAVTLRLKFTPGQTLYYSLTTDTDGKILTGASGAGVPLKNHMEMLMHQTVKDVRATDGAATLESGIDHMSMTISMNGQTFPIPEDKMPQVKVVGTTVILPTGKILSFTPNPALAAANAMPGMDLSKANAYAGLGQLPDVPVKAGDTWKSAVSAALAGAQITSGFTLASLDTSGGKNVAVLNQTMDGTFDTSTPKTAPAGAAPKKVTGKINGTGVLRFDVDAGSMESVTSQMNMAMTIAAPGAPGGVPTGGMNIQMKINTSMKRAEAPAPGAGT